MRCLWSLLLLGACVSAIRHVDEFSSQRERDYFEASGLGGAPSKYDSDSTLKQVWDEPGTFFSGVYSSHMVLQRAPEKAGLTGVVVGAKAGTTVTIDVTESSTGTSYTVSAATTIESSNSTVGKWTAYLKPAAAGGNYTITVACANCESPFNTSTIEDVTFGDVYFCSGQSNMWLPVNFDTSRNNTFDKIMEGKYQNIRFHTMVHNNQPDGGYEGYDLDLAPEPPTWRAYGGNPAGPWFLPQVGTYANETCRSGAGDQCNGAPAADSGCCVAYPNPNNDWFYNSVNQFSATCWYFAEHLTDEMERNNETIVPLGLVASHWGGTMVEMWIPNATLNNAACKNNSGGAYEPWQNERWDIDSGALYNGMVRPFLRMTIKAVLWYQGENNMLQCHDADSNTKGNRGKSGGPTACGSNADGTGYACMMKTLIETWRAAWSAEPGTTNSDFPFGIVSLAGGTSEGFGSNMGAMRYAQAGSSGLLPSKALPNTFIAQTYDTGDPCDGGGQCCQNEYGGWPCMSGEAPFTVQFMGGLHPRMKKVAGTRLAKAARKHIYGDNTVAWTGPVLQGCNISNGVLNLKFNADMLPPGDAVMVTWQNMYGIGLQDFANMDIHPDSSMLQLMSQLGGQSPFEVQINGNNFTDGYWVPVSPRAKCHDRPMDNPIPGKGECTEGIFDEVQVDLAADAHQAPMSVVANITGIRYAWGENPCCTSLDRRSLPCPPNNCPIQTFNSSLPAVPFWATIKDGKCDWISINGPPPATL